MSSGTTSHEYVLGRDYLASARLNLQHYLWIQEVGYHLHPSIASKMEDAVIADVATGTGIWMTDLAFKMPNSTFHGFDVDLAQAPPSEWLPPNVKLDTLDLFKPLPDVYVEKFDVVHLRLLMCVIKEDPIPVLNNLMSMLKPGGILQWGEMDFSTHRFDKARDEISTEELARAGKYASTLSSHDARLDQKWITGLGELFESAGLEVLANDHQFRDASRLSPYQDVAFMMWEELRSKMASPYAEEYAGVLDAAKSQVQEAHRGLSINMEIRTVVGRRA